MNPHHSGAPLFLIQSWTQLRMGVAGDITQERNERTDLLLLLHRSHFLVCPASNFSRWKSWLRSRSGLITERAAPTHQSETCPSATQPHLDLSVQPPHWDRQEEWNWFRYARRVGICPQRHADKNKCQRAAWNMSPNPRWLPMPLALAVGFVWVAKTNTLFSAGGRRQRQLRQFWSV